MNEILILQVCVCEMFERKFVDPNGSWKKKFILKSKKKENLQKRSLNAEAIKKKMTIDYQ